MTKVEAAGVPMTVLPKTVVIDPDSKDGALLAVFLGATVAGVQVGGGGCGLGRWRYPGIDRDTPVVALIEVGRCRLSPGRSWVDSRLTPVEPQLDPILTPGCTQVDPKFISG
jgi:hypothetical protein